MTTSNNNPMNQNLIEDVVRRVIANSIPSRPGSCAVCRHSLKNPRNTILEIGGLIYDRHLSDSAGGNISCRVGNLVYITPRYMGESFRYKQLLPDQIILADETGKVIDGDPNLVSREGNLHFGVYKTFPEICACIHAHPRNILPFATLGVPIPSVTDMTDHFELGEIQCCAPAAPASEELAENCIRVLSGKREAMQKFGAAVMIPKHGIIVVAKDLNIAYVLLETIETAAYITLQISHLKKNGSFNP
ncbi:MAG: class II aldolase/adducin family protein [Planctomycetes bacterium]|nr:class II aldolase/adducin family protein [Planctomycetota bacterium]